MRINFIEDQHVSNDKSGEETIALDSKLKELLVNYVGENNKNIKNEEVTVSEIVETMAQEFPEFLLVIAEENWIRGYHQALADVELGETLSKEEARE